MNLNDRGRLFQSLIFVGSSFGRNCRNLVIGRIKHVESIARVGLLIGLFSWSGICNAVFPVSLFLV